MSSIKVNMPQSQETLRSWAGAHKRFRQTHRKDSYKVREVVVCYH